MFIRNSFSTTESLGRFSRSSPRAAFTIVEMIMVMVVVGILAAVSVPQFVNYRKEAKDAKLKMILGSIRAGIANQYAQGILRCDKDAGDWPSLAALNANDVITSAWCADAGADEAKFVAGVDELPDNPWGDNNTVIAADAAAIADHCNPDGCDDATAGGDLGWCYDAATGQFWADSQANGDATEECSF